MTLENDDLLKFSLSGVLPLRVSETGKLGDPLEEVIICDSISGGAQHELNMPKELGLIRKLADGTEYRMRYMQITSPEEEAISNLREFIQGVINDLIEHELNAIQEEFKGLYELEVGLSQAREDILKEIDHFADMVKREDLDEN